MLQRGRKRLPLNAADRFLWVCLSSLWVGWRSALAIFKPATEIRWHRTGFRRCWRWKSRGLRLGRHQIPQDVQDLIREMSLANPLWGAPRIHGERLKLGIPLSQATVAKYMVHTRKPPSQTWRAFLNNHITQLASTDFFVVPAVTFRVLFVFVVLAHHRRRVIHFNVTGHPTSERTAQQIAEAFPWDSAPRYLLHDRDSIYGNVFRQRVREMPIREVLTAPRSPWQSPYVERLIGSVRRECLDHVLVFNESFPRRTLKLYFDYCHGARTHLLLEEGAPETRPVQAPELGSVPELAEIGGLQHRHEWRAA
jgi:transposase InsO family protein